MSKVHVCTPCAYGGDLRAASLLKESCDQVGVKLHMVGTDTSWSNHFNVKVPTMIKHLRILPPDQLVMTIDCVDTLMLASPDKLRRHLKGLGDLILMSSEKNCEPNRGLAGQLNEIHHFKGKYPNSGGIAGKAGVLLNAYLDLMTYYRTENDQESWHMWCIEHPYRVLLDLPGEVWLSMQDQPEYNWDPCVVHYAGGVSGREDLWKHINMVPSTLT
jgi:hypothetical protein